jgi:hypothetical protein
MAKLKTLANTYPLSPLRRALMTGAFNSPMANMLFIETMTHLVNDPNRALDQKFWQSRNDRINQEGGRKHFDLEYYAKKNKKRFPETLADAIQYASIELERQLTLVDQLDPMMMYAEGIKEGSVLGSYVQKKGRHVIYLDEGNTPYSKLVMGFFEDEFREQQEREVVWVEKIVRESMKGFPPISDSLLVTGSQHVQNKYGLSLMLARFDIELDEVKMPNLFVRLLPEILKN